MLFTFTSGMVPLMERKMANAADYNRWGPPADDRVSYQMRSPWHIVLIVLGFIIWWPVGLALLFFTLGSRKMGCWDRHGRFENKMERMQYKMERMRNRMERSPASDRASASARRPRATAPSTNIASKPCAASRKNSTSSRTSSIVCVTPRTRKSSTSSWRSTARSRPRHRITISRRANSPELIGVRR
jgi:hypothetical protein